MKRVSLIAVIAGIVTIVTIHAVFHIHFTAKSGWITFAVGAFIGLIVQWIIAAQKTGQKNRQLGHYIDRSWQMFISLPLIAILATLAIILHHDVWVMLVVGLGAVGVLCALLYSTLVTEPVKQDVRRTIDMIAGALVVLGIIVVAIHFGIVADIIRLIHGG